MRELLVLVEFCRHPIMEAQVARVEEYAAALGESGPGLVMARDLVAQGREIALADFRRFLEENPFDMLEPTLKDAVLARRSPRRTPSSRRGCARSATAVRARSGRAYVEFYERNGLTCPATTRRSRRCSSRTTCAHVIGGYEPVAIDEIGLGAMQLGIDDTDTHWLRFLGNLSVHEAGFLTSEDGTLVPKEATLSRPGAAADLRARVQSRRALRAETSRTIDHLAIADRPLEDVREEFGVPPREC